MVIRRPALCLVTDRRRLGAGRPPREALEALPLQVAAAAAAGIDLVQVRERDLPDGALCALVRRCVEAAAGTPTRVLVNDRLDVALAAGAAGVHLRADGMPVERVRAAAPPGFLIGRSVHSPGEAAAAAAADYLVFGTVFPSEGKPADQRVAGLEALAAATARCAVPVLAIGGIDAGRAPLVAAAGAAGVAAIGWFLDTDAARLAERATRMRRAFDTP